MVPESFLKSSFTVPHFVFSIFASLDKNIKKTAWDNFILFSQQNNGLARLNGIEKNEYVK
jgi:hypothetical protein